MDMEILTMMRATTDSVIHLLFLRRWPMTTQAQRRRTNRVMESTEAISGDEEDIPNLITIELELKAMTTTFFFFFCHQFKQSLHR